MSYSTTSSLVAYHSANYLSSYSEVSKVFKSFLGKVFAAPIEYNRRQTASMTNSSSNHHTHCLSLVQFYFNAPI